MEKAFSGRFANIRPTFISGPGDETDRFGYFPIRVSRRGDALPGHAGRWAEGSRCSSSIRASGSVAAAPLREQGERDLQRGGAESGGDVWRAARNQQGSEQSKHHVHLGADGVHREHPAAEARRYSIWIPPEGEEAGMATISIDRAAQAGLKCRPVRDREGHA